MYLSISKAIGILQNLKIARGSNSLQSIECDLLQSPIFEVSMIGASQSPRDRILWVLANSGGKMKRSRLRRCVGVRYAVLDPLLAELIEEGRIRIEDGNIMAIKNAGLSG
jgi:hypothetical protein